MNSVRERYTSKQVASLVGITYRQLYHWLKLDVVSCEFPGQGRGKISLFSFSDVLEAKVVAHLVNNGIKLSVIKSCIKQIRKEFYSTAFPSGLRSIRVLTDGKRIYAKYYCKENQVIELNEHGQFGFAFGFDLNEQQDSLVEMAEKLDINLPIGKRA